MITQPLCPKCGGPVTKDGGNSTHGRYIGTQRYKCRPCRWSGTQPVGVEDALGNGIDRKATGELHRAIRALGTKARFVITAAQNATPVNKDFFNALLRYCDENCAQLVVIPYRYKNPTSLWSKRARGEDWWAEEITPFLLDRRIALNANLILMADVKTQPTAVNPLEGFETVTGGLSAIIGHPKLELTTVATPQQKLPKILASTGAVTVKNYINCKAGKKAAHHHTFGAVVVEVHGKLFHLRQLNAVRDGSFIDLDREYLPSGSRPAGRAAALVMGDSHVEFIDPKVVKATFGPGSIIEKLQPEQLVWHDVCDFYARNHHHRGEPFINYAKYWAGKDGVEAGVKQAFLFVQDHTPDGTLSVFVPSNHPDALARWVKEADPKSDPQNAVFWAQTFTAMCEGARWTDVGASTIDPFAYWGKRWFPADPWRFLGRGESYAIKKIEISFHGDRGPSGSRGSRKAYSRIGVKTIIGHSHSPGIREGCYQVGTSSFLNLPYASGEPSSWLHTHCVIYANGKRSLIHVIDGEWHHDPKPRS